MIASATTKNTSSIQKTMQPCQVLGGCRGKWRPRAQLQRAVATPPYYTPARSARRQVLSDAECPAWELAYVRLGTHPLAGQPTSGLPLPRMNRLTCCLYLLLAALVMSIPGVHAQPLDDPNTP